VRLISLQPALRSLAFGGLVFRFFDFSKLEAKLRIIVEAGKQYQTGKKIILVDRNYKSNALSVRRFYFEFS
ncbi:MAG: hypothetical protein MUO30_03245, partial [Anaerolineales bacterium]|nr:hypothetical protein [Anaerolineales bacterium]